MTNHTGIEQRTSRLCVTLSTKLLEHVDAMPCVQSRGQSSTKLRQLLCQSLNSREEREVDVVAIAKARAVFGTRTINCTPTTARRVVDDAIARGITISECVERHVWSALRLQ